MSAETMKFSSGSFVMTKGNAVSIGVEVSLSGLTEDIQYAAPTEPPDAGPIFMVFPPRWPPRGPRLTGIAKAVEEKTIAA